MSLADLRGGPVVLYFYPKADAGHAVCESYGVWVEKNMYGRKYRGVERTTFVIDAEGTVTEVMRKVKPKEHDKRVLAVLSD